ncbi:MAG: copper chaperone PCu(A)C [Betaproteobacteria bacterium]
MTRFQLTLFVVTSFATLVAEGAIAADYHLKSLHIDQAFMRATPPGAQVAGAFLTIENRGKDADRLVGASSPVAGQVEIHEMAMDGGVMKMRAVKEVDLPPGAKVQLRPGGYHVMLQSLKQPLKAGDAMPLTLTFEKAGSIDIKVQVEAMGAGMHSR